MFRHAVLAVFGLGSTLAACGGGAGAKPAPAAEAPAAAAAPAATGTVIDVKAVSSGADNYFEPKRITAKQGDRLKLILESGVHNLSFPAEQNPGATGLPAATEMLQLPGQTAEVVVGMSPGTYKFQCDPHAAIGMVGELVVVP